MAHFGAGREVNTTISADVPSVLAVTEENEIHMGTFAVQLGRAGWG